MTGVRINKSAVINLLIQSQSITQRDRMSRVTRRNQPRHDSKQPRQGPVGFVCSGALGFLIPNGIEMSTS